MERRGEREGCNGNGGKLKRREGEKRELAAGKEKWLRVEGKGRKSRNRE